MLVLVCITGQLAQALGREPHAAEAVPTPLAFAAADSAAASQSSWTLPEQGTWRHLPRRQSWASLPAW